MPLPSQNAVAQQSVEQGHSSPTDHHRPAAPSGHPVQYGVQTGQGCPNCQQPWTEQAHFCGACGHGSLCPQCSAPCNGCDFCESCGHWLLTGQCRFCYEPLLPEAQFCHECGCDQEGLWCAHCNQRCHFDFCTGCGEALSPQAIALSARLWEGTGDPTLDAALQALRELGQQCKDDAALEGADSQRQSLPDSVACQSTQSQAIQAERGSPFAFDEDDGLPAPVLPGAVPPPMAVRRSLVARTALRALQRIEDEARQEAAPHPVVPSQPLGVTSPPASLAMQKEAVPQDTLQTRSFDDVLDEREQLRLQALQAARQDALQALIPVMQAAAHQKFKTHQQARAYYQNVAQLWRKQGGGLLGWRCHYADYVHFSPNQCACPALGGEWIWSAA